MEWTHTSANLQHAKTTARREQSRESDAPEKHWCPGGEWRRCRGASDPPPPLQVTAPHIRGIYITRRMHVHVAAGDIGLAPGPRKPPASLARPLLGGYLAQPATNREGSKGSAQRIGARREGRGALLCAPFIHPLLRGDVDPVGGAAPVDRQEPRRPTCSGRLRSGAQHKVALDSAGLGRGSPAVDRLDLRWAVGRARVVVALRRGGRLTTARHPAGTPPNTAQGGRGGAAGAGGRGGRRAGCSGCVPSAHRRDQSTPPASSSAPRGVLGGEPPKLRPSSEAPSVALTSSSSSSSSSSPVASSSLSSSSRSSCS